MANPVRMARAADRALPVLFGVLFVALLTSITAVRAVSALIAVTAAVSLLDRDLRQRYRVPLAVPLGVFAALTVLSAVTADAPLRALGNSRHLLYLTLFVVAANAFRDGRAAWRALRWLFVTAAVAGAWALAQVAVCGVGGDAPRVVGPVADVVRATCRTALPFRPTGFFAIHMTLGGVLGVVLSLLAARIAVDRTARTAGTLLPAASGLIALAAAQTRHAWAGLATALTVMAALTHRRTAMVVMATIVIVTLVVPLALTVAPMTFSAEGRRQLREAGGPAPGLLLPFMVKAVESAYSRREMWVAGARMARDRPALGVGPGEARFAYPRYAPLDAARAHVPHLHNNIVQIAAERGLLGLAAWCWIWVMYVAAAARIHRALPAEADDERAIVVGSLAVVVGFLAAGLFEYNFGDPHVVNLVWIVMGLPFALAPSTPRREVARAPSPSASS